MKNSQYLNEYVNETLNELKNNKKPYSVGTFLAYRLEGTAKKYMGRYKTALENSLKRIGWEPCKSKLGGLAYGPNSI